MQKFILLHLLGSFHWCNQFLKQKENILLSFFLIKYHIEVKCEVPPEKISSIMPNWHHSDSYSRTQSDFDMT